jgi:hypothetical protein
MGRTYSVETNKRSPDLGCAGPVVLLSPDIVVEELGQIVDVIRVVKIRPLLSSMDPEPAKSLQSSLSTHFLANLPLILGCNLVVGTNRTRRVK